MVWPLIALVRDDAGPEALASYLETDLYDHFGFGQVEGQRPVAERLHRWWLQEGAGTELFPPWEQVLEPVLPGALAQLELLDPRARLLLAAYWLTGPDAGPAVAQLAGHRGDEPVGHIWPSALAELGVPTPVPRARRLVLPWLARRVVAGRAEPSALLALGDRLDERADPLVDELLAELQHTVDVSDEAPVEPAPKRFWLPWRRQSAPQQPGASRIADVRLGFVAELLAFGRLEEATEQAARR